ncbi:MAG: hypothetical protein AAGE98_03790 [Actinomycetota bacterium]
MDEPATVDGISLADPSVPIDPEQAATTLGTTLAARHAAVPTAAGVVDLAAFAAAVRDAAESVDDAPIESGPYLDRSRRDLARIAVDTVAALPPSDDPPVAITPGLTLDMVTVQRDGSMVIGADTVAGDRHLDTARVAVALAIRFGTAVVAPFLAAYGLDDVDLRRLDTCQLLTSVAAELGVTEPVDAT